MKPIFSKALIVGVEGGIGRALYELLLPSYNAVYGTSRREQDGEIFFQIDLSNDFTGLKKIPNSCNIAFICAATTKIVDCENDRVGSYAVNVTNTVKLVSTLQDLGMFVVWLSSNAVFSGKRPFSGLDEPYMPLTEYGRQKAAAEREIIELGGVAIIRLTKVLSKDTPLIASWIKNLKNGEKIYSFSDSYFCPISLKFAIDAIAKVGCNFKEGIFNISGSDDISYFDFARMLAINSCGGDDLIRPVNKAMMQSTMLFNGRFGSLDMSMTTSSLDIKPQLLTEVLADIM